jgi:hypothetical protein
MGNKVAKCAQPFQLSPAGVFQCVPTCPEDKGFILQNVGGNPTCVYKDDPSYKLPLTAAPARFVEPNAPNVTFEQLRATEPQIYSAYKAAQDKFNKEFPVLYEQIDKQVKIRNAFKALQDAENVRDQSPQAYQEARVRYYTLTKGDAWLQEERQRIAKAEVDPTVQRFQQMRDENLRRLQQQQTTRDVVTNVKDKVVGLRDELKYSVNTFQKQINDIKDQINIENRVRKAEKAGMSTTEKINWFLNIALVLLLCISVYMLFRKLSGPSQPRQAYTLIPVRSNAAV